MLPVTRPVEVRCIGCDWSSEKMEQGKVALDLDFVEAGAQGGYPAIPIGDRIAQGALDGLGAAVGQAISGFKAR